MLAWTALLAHLFVVLFPFYWMLRTAFSNNRALAANYSSPLPADFTLGAFARVLGLQSSAESIAQGGSGAALDFWLYLRNSVVVATTLTVSQVLFCALAAYAFARLRWPGRDQLFFVFLTGLLVPSIFTLLPNFLLIRDLGLINTFVGIILPTMLMSPFTIFFLRQFFLTISHEIEDAAKIDGASHLRIFFRIIVPMSSGPLATIVFLTYVTAWNEYMWPLVVGSADNVRVLAVALGVFRAQTPTGAPDSAGLMAAACITVLPIMLLYLVLGRRIVSSIGFSGVK